MQLTPCSIFLFTGFAGLITLMSFGLFGGQIIRFFGGLRRSMSRGVRMVAVSAAAAALILLIVSIPRHIEIVPCGGPATANLLNGAGQTAWSTVVAEAARITCTSE